MPKIPDDVPWTRTGNTLGSGGQASIDEVKPKDVVRFPDKLYTMKELRNVSSSQAKERFIKEIEAINSINDPRIVSIFDHSKADQSFQYYVMPKYDAIILSDIIYEQESPFLKNPIRCLQFIADCAEALHACHEKQIVHRDIKPENILVNNKTQSPTILDFGCCHKNNGDMITLTNEAVGTPDYMAPECGAGSPEEVSNRADIYSLGKLLWAIITGKRMFARENPAFNSHNLQKIFPHNPDCWHLTLIFEKSIRNNSSHRYESCMVLAEHCRSLSRNFVGKHPPLEKVSITCPACGNSNEPNHVPGQYEIRPDRLKMALRIQNIRDADVDCCQCYTCGYIYLWNNKILSEKFNRLKTMA